jgi:hypothetical protein
MDETGWRGWIRAKIQSPDPLLWVNENSLAFAGAPRPLRYHAEFGGPSTPAVLPCVRSASRSDDSLT